MAAGELIHTEEEASKILCPQFKAGCRGSGCMWWRWFRIVWEEGERGMGVVLVPEERRRTNRGYCGVAGQP